MRYSGLELVAAAGNDLVEVVLHLAPILRVHALPPGFDAALHLRPLQAVELEKVVVPDQPVGLEVVFPHAVAGG